MALQVWLPLTKDLRNQGLSDLTFSLISTNTAIDTAGKLGKCYTNNTLNGGGLLSDKTIDLGQYQSMFCWFKFVDLTSSSSLGGGLVSQHRYPSNQGMGITIKYVSSTTGYLSVNTGTGSSRTFNTYCGTTLLQANTWYHGGYTYNNGTLKIYVNGNCEYTGSIGTMSVPADYITAFCWSMGSSSGNGVYGGYKLHGSLNDIRIYNHCLSPMEVKQLAQGLVLHYSLNRQGWGQENLVTGSNTNSTSTNSWAIGSQTGGNTKTIEQDETGTYCVKFVRDSTAQSGWYYLSYSNLLRNQIKTDTTYTLTFDCKASVSSSITFTGLLNGNATNYMTNSTTNIQSTVVANQWCHMKYQCKTISSFDGITIGSQVVYLAPQAALKAVGVTVYFKNIKLEEGENATPWCPNSSDILATTMGLNGTTEYDCSGFCNNGEKTGTFTYTSDTPKYAVSTTLGNNTTKLHISGLSTTGFANSYSFAWWGKTSTFSNMMQWGFSDGIRLNGIYNGTLWNTGDSSNNPLYNPGTTTQVTAPTTNVWHHYVMVGDGTTCKVYKDGILWGQAKTYKAISGTSIYFNGWDSGTSYSHTSGYSMSDFRIYATALSADDVKSLYQNSAYIDSSGNVYGAVHTEV